VLQVLLLVLLSACDAAEAPKALGSATRRGAETDAGSAAPAQPQGAPVTPNPPAPPAPATPPCSIGCGSNAYLAAHLPVDIQLARHWRFEACHNDTCFEGRQTKDAQVVDTDEGAHLYLLSMDSAGMWSSRVSFKLSRMGPDGPTSIEVAFMPESIGTRSADRYAVRATDEASGVVHVLLDASVTYRIESRVIGENCELSCWVARVDTRNVADSDAGI
jgi:hypothetical protein